MDDTILFVGFLIEVIIQSCKLQAKHADCLEFGIGWIRERAQHIKKCLDTECFTYRGYRFHRRVEKWGMQKADAGFIQLLLQFIKVIGKRVAQIFHHIGGTASRGDTHVTMLSDMVPCSSYYKRCARRNINGVFSVSPVTA